MEKNLDLRVQKTRKALLRALYSLLCEKNFDDITVTELCARAETRKATFYKHFGDKRELFTFMVREMQQVSKEENQIHYEEKNPKSYYIGVFHYFLDFLDQNEPFVRKILDSSAASALIDLMSEEIETDIRIRLTGDLARGKPLPAEPNVLAAIYTGAMVYCGRWWICNDRPLDKETVIARFSELSVKL